VPAAEATAQAPAEKAPENESAARKLPPGSVPPPRAEQPSRGPLNAPVLIQVFSDFECPYCQKTPPLIGELEHEFGVQIRVVWRALPLPGHALARESATAALEAHAQRGSATFWRVHDRLFVEATDGLTQREIELVLQSEGVDVARYREALKSGARDAAIAADVAAADATAVEGTPAFLINDYYLYGSQPIEILRAVVEVALEER
jgi:protein-disulfide isomerase